MESLWWWIAPRTDLLRDCGRVPPFGSTLLAHSVEDPSGTQFQEVCYISLVHSVDGMHWSRRQPLFQSTPPCIILEVMHHPQGQWTQPSSSILVENLLINKLAFLPCFPSLLCFGFGWFGGFPKLLITGTHTHTQEPTASGPLPFHIHFPFLSLPEGCFWCFWHFGP